jgi:ketosteroid isomerase-like protein
MKPSTLVDAVARFVDAMNAGRLEDALAMYEPEATLVVQPGVVAQGTAALREALAGMIAMKPTLRTHAQHVVYAGDLALYCGRWSMSGTDAAGNPLHERGCSADVLRRHPDGQWRIVLDNPWGAAVLPDAADEG